MAQLLFPLTPPKENFGSEPQAANANALRFEDFLAQTTSLNTSKTARSSEEKPDEIGLDEKVKTTETAGDEDLDAEESVDALNQADNEKGENFFVSAAELFGFTVCEQIQDFAEKGLSAAPVEEVVSGGTGGLPGDVAELADLRFEECAKTAEGAGEGAPDGSFSWEGKAVSLEEEEVALKLDLGGLERADDAANTSFTPEEPEAAAVLPDGGEPAGETAAAVALNAKTADKKAKNAASPFGEGLDGKNGLSVEKKETVPAKEDAGRKSAKEIRPDVKNSAQSKASASADKQENGPTAAASGGERQAESLKQVELTVNVETQRGQSVSEAQSSAQTSPLTEAQGRNGSLGGTVADGGVEKSQNFLSRELQASLNGDIVRHASIMLRDGGEGAIRLSLKPESLGNVKIRLHMAENKVSGQILVETQEALKAFEEQVHNLEKAFEAQGYESAKLETSISGGEGRGERRAETHTGAVSSAVASAVYDKAGGLEAESQAYRLFFPNSALNVLA
jgi:flagellar hook-length control protein FliK